MRSTAAPSANNKKVSHVGQRKRVLHGILFFKYIVKNRFSDSSKIVCVKQTIF